LTTFIANVIGCFLIGLFIGIENTPLQTFKFFDLNSAHIVKRVDFNHIGLESKHIDIIANSFEKNGRIENMRISVKPTTENLHQIQQANNVNQANSTDIQVLKATAVLEELTSLINKQVFTPIMRADIPSNNHILPTHMLMKEKVNASGDFERWKARCVVNSAITPNKPSEDQFNYSGTIKLETVFMLFNLCIYNSWDIIISDIRTAYLNAPVKGTVYINFNKHISKILVEKFPLAFFFLGFFIPILSKRTSPNCFGEFILNSTPAKS
jgi:hypothetical protein